MIDSNLGEIAVVLKTGKTPPSKESKYFEGNYNWYTPGDVTTIKYLTSSQRQISNVAVLEGKVSVFPKNSLLITCIGNIGRVGISLEECSTNQQITAITPAESVNVEYLYYWFIANQELLIQKANNAVVPILNNKMLKEISFSYPPLETQKHIAQILDDATALRDKTRQLLKEYDALAQSIFLDMFGDPRINLKKWELTELTKLIIQKPDNGFFTKNDFYGNTGMPVVWISDFINKVYVEVNNLKRAKINEKDLKYRLNYGDALFCRSSLTPEGIGKCAIVPKNLTEDIIFECHIIRLRFDLTKVVPEYFRFLSDTAFFRNCIKKSAKTSTMTTISQDGISSIKIPVPPIAIQNQFAEKIAVIEQQKELAKQELKESEDLFNCLLQKAFKGQLT